MKFIYAILLFSLIAVSSFSAALAHGPLEKITNTEGEYTAELRYDPQDIEIEGSTNFSFFLQNSQTGEDVEFDNIWLRVSKDEKSYLTGPIAISLIGPSAITYKFPDTGRYEISARFQKGSESIIESSFPLDVDYQKESGSNDTLVKAIFAAAGAIVGIIIGVFLTIFLTTDVKKSKKESKKQP